MIGNPRERGIAAVLRAPNQPAELLEVFVRLHPPRAAQFVCIRRFPQHGIDELGGRHPVDPRQPPGHAGAQSIEHLPNFVTERFACWRPLGGLGTAWLGEDGGGDGWRQARKGGIRNPHDTRAQKRGSTQIRERIGQVPEQADCILNLIGVEEAKAFVHIGPHAAAIERRLIFTVAVA